MSRAKNEATTYAFFSVFLGSIMPPAFGEFIVKKLIGSYPSRLARFLPDAALAPLTRLVRWAVTDPLVPADSPTAYEYMIIADASEYPR